MGSVSPGMIDNGGSQREDMEMDRKRRTDDRGDLEFEGRRQGEEVDALRCVSCN